MACIDCFKNCAGGPVSDGCVKYTGPEIPLLGICTGDTLTTVTAAIVEKLLSALDGTGITVEDVTLENCQWLKDIFGPKEQTLVNLIQLLIDSNCTLKELIDELTPDPYVFNTVCLSGLPANPTPNDILQAALTLLCSIKTTVDSFPTTYVKLADLTTLVQSIISGNNTTITYNTRMVPYAAMPYFGPLSNFDNTGKGLSGIGFDKIYLCNGLNGTPDLRGRSVVGAVRNVPGGTLDAAVDPANLANSVTNVNYALNDKFGENFHQLSVAEAPSHSHGITDPGHIHAFLHGRDEGGNKNGNGWMKWDSSGFSKNTNSGTTGITINSTGGNGRHENRQPSIAAYWIIYLP